MLKKLSTIGFASIAALGCIAVPALADTAVVQTGTQDLYVEGEGNKATQESEQINHTRRVNPRAQDGSTGIVQDSYQGGTVLGEDNRTHQGSSQVNVSEEKGRRRLLKHGRED
jgi:hypothetical protein